MRVIAGSARGRRLIAPSGLATRPLTDRIKESLFNILNPRLADCRFLDLFAGSGSAGIEALSRGAARAVFVDINEQALRCLRNNLEQCGFAGRGDIMRSDVMKCLPRLALKENGFNIIYADPPFTQPELFEPFMRVMDDCSGLLDREGLMIIRSPRGMELPADLNKLIRCRREQYGESVLHFYQIQEVCAP